MKLRLQLLLITSFCVFQLSLLAQSGSNDPQFNSAGVGFNTNDGANSVSAIIIQPSGKIILGNTTLYNGVVTPRIVRINPDGDIDPTFNPGIGANNYVGALETQSTGKIIVSGTFTQYNGVARNRLARLNSDGSLDLTFDGGTNVPAGTITRVFIQPDDKILIAIGGGFPLFIRLNSDGSADPTFNSGSNAINLWNVVFQPDGKMIVSGSFSTFNGTTANSVVRLNSNGSIDPTFNSGIAASALPYNSVIQPDGKIVITGWFQALNGNPAFRGLVRLNTDGSLDPTLNVGAGFDNTPENVLLQPDGKLIVSGIFTSYNSIPVGPVVRLNPDGSLETVGGPGGTAAKMKFTNSGKIMVGGSLIGGYGYKGIARMDQNTLLIDTTFNTTSTLIRGANDAVRCVALQADNKILIGGVFNVYNGMNRNRFARLNSNGGIDPTFNIGSGPNGDVISMRVQPDGKIVIGGGFGFYNSVSRLRIARINSDGSVDMTFNPGTAANNIVVNTELQTDGKILIGGFFTAYNGNTSNYIARVNADGSYDGLFNIGTGANGSVYSTPVQPDGKIIVAGTFTMFNGVNQNRILRLNSDGTTDNSFATGTGASGSIYVALIQPDGKIIIGGQFSSYNGTARKNIARLNSDGTLDLSFDPGTGFNNNINTVSIQSDGKLIVGGQFSLFNGTSRSGIARLNVDGSLDLTFNPGAGINSGGVWGSAIQPDGNIIITGGFTNYNGVSRNRIARVLNGSCSPTFFNVTASDASCYGTANGSINLNQIGGTAPFNFLWNDGITSEDRTNLPPGTYSVNIIDASGCTASYNASINSPLPIAPTSFSHESCDLFNWNGQILTTSGVYQQIVASSTGCDSTITLNLTITHSTTGTDVQTACDSYDWIDGNTYTSSTNTPTFILQNAAGCDSTVTLNLTITSSTTGTDVQTACDSYDWIDGNTYTSSTNTPTFVLQNAAGCDSTVTLNLTITHSTTGTDVQTACDSYDWIDGNTYTSSTNTSTFVLQNAAGCDSTVTLNLTITSSTTGTDVQTACDSYDWIDGNTYTSSTTTPTFVLQNVAGCDSTVTLNLTITHSTTGTDVQTACDSYDWIDGNTYTSSTNTPTFVLQNAAGCDSTVTLNLTITNSTIGTDIQTACDSFDWIDGNTYTSSTNTPTFVLQNATGCDSTVTLNLTIIPSLPLVVENVFVFPSDANSCVGAAAIDISGNADFEMDFDNGSQIITSNGYSLVATFCPGVHDLQVTDNCGDTLSIPVVIPVDSNYVFNNPFIDSLAIDSLGVTMTNCNIYYNSIDTAYIDSIWANGNTVNVIWNIIDSNGSNFDTTSYVLNNGNGVYWLQLSVFCPFKSVGEYFTVTEAIYFNNGNVSTAGLPDFTANLFEIYPNPTNDQVHISFSGSDAELTVYDLQGKVVLQDRIQNHAIVSLQNFERGVYLFDFKNSQGHSIQRVVKQ